MEGFVGMSLDWRGVKDLRPFFRLFVCLWTKDGDGDGDGNRWEDWITGWRVRWDAREVDYQLYLFSPNTP